MIPSNNNNNNIPTMEGLAAVLSNQKQNDIPTYEDIRNMPKYAMFVGEKSNIKPMPNPVSVSNSGIKPNSDQDIWNKYGYYPKEFNDKKNGIYELDDSKATLNPKVINSNITGMPLDKVFLHPTLYKAYPQLKNVKVDAYPDIKYRNNGQYNPEDNVIYLNTSKNNDQNYKNVIAHEVQHAIQEIEGKPLSIPTQKFKNLPNLKSDDNDVMYLSDPYEVDAFSTGNRINMPPQQRRQITPALMTNKGINLVEGHSPLVHEFYNANDRAKRQVIFNRIHAMP